MQMKITIHEKEPAIHVTAIDELDSALSKAADEAKQANKLNIIFLEVTEMNYLLSLEVMKLF